MAALVASALRGHTDVSRRPRPGIQISTSINLQLAGVISQKGAVVFVCFVAALPPSYMQCVLEGWTSLNNCTCCQSEIEIEQKTCALTQSKHTDTGPTSQSTDSIM